MDTKTTFTLRLPNSICNKIGNLIEKGQYSDYNDFIIQAVYYELNKIELRYTFKQEVIEDVETLFRRILSSSDNVDIIQKVAKNVLNDILEKLKEKR